MSSHHHNPRILLTTEMRQLIERIHRAGHPPMQAMTPQQARAFYTAGAPLLDSPPPQILNDGRVKFTIFGR